MATDTGTSTTDDTTTDDDSTDDSGTDTGAGGGSETDDSGADDDGDAAKWKALARKHEKEAKQQRARADKLEHDGKTEQEKALEKAREEGRQEAAAAALESNVETALESIAETKLSDPSFVRLLDADDRETFVSDGKVDRKAIGKALDALVKKHPNIAKNGSATGLPGSRGSTSAASGFDMNEEIRRRAGRG